MTDKANSSNGNGVKISTANMRFITVIVLLFATFAGVAFAYSAIKYTANDALSKAIAAKNEAKVVQRDLQLQKNEIISLKLELKFLKEGQAEIKDSLKEVKTLIVQKRP